MRSSHSRESIADSMKQRASVVAARLPPLGAAEPPAPPVVEREGLPRLPLASNTSVPASSSSWPSASAVSIPVPAGHGGPLGWGGEDRPVLHSSLHSRGGVARRRNAGVSERLEPLQRGETGRGSGGTGGTTNLGTGSQPVWAPPRPLPAAMLRTPAASRLPFPSSSTSASDAANSLNTHSGNGSGGAMPVVPNLSLSKASSTPSLVASRSSLGAAAGYMACGVSGRGSPIKRQQQQQQQQQKDQQVQHSVQWVQQPQQNSSRGNGTRTSPLDQGLKQPESNQKRVGLVEGSIGEQMPRPLLASRAKPSTCSAAAGGNAAQRSASAPTPAARLQAVASLQRLFFEEVRRSGDPNAAAAAALLRLAEESRPPVEGEHPTLQALASSNDDQPYC